MTPLVAAAVLTAAVSHAAWNALAHAIRDQLVAFTLIGAGALVAGAVLVCLAPLPAVASRPYLLASALLHTAYQLLLMRAFTLGDFGQTYPIARGTAPLVVTVLAAVLVGETLTPAQTAGVAVCCAGLLGGAVWGMRDGRAGGGGRGRRGAGGGTSAPDGTRRPQWPAVAAALATGFAIASYTVVDGVGVRSSGTALGYIGWLMMLQGFLIPAWALWTRRGGITVGLRAYAARGLLAGLLSVFAYGLVLWAQTRAALAPVATLRESSIIVGAAIGTVFFKERFGIPRIAAAVLMVAGIGLMLRAG